MGLIYLDACLVIYLAESHERWGEAVAKAIAEAAGARFAMSPLTKCECLVGPIKRGDPVLQRAYMALFEQFAALAMPEAVYLQAAQASRSLCDPDARRSAPRLRPAPWLRGVVDE
jgi:hypothetical protein